MRRMRAAGVRFTPRKGTSHYRIEYKGRISTFPRHDRDDMDPRLIKTICRQIGFDWRKILKS